MQARGTQTLQVLFRPPHIALGTYLLNYGALTTAAHRELLGWTEIRRSAVMKTDDVFTTSIIHAITILAHYNISRYTESHIDCRMHQLTGCFITSITACLHMLGNGQGK